MKAMALVLLLVSLQVTRAETHFFRVAATQATTIVQFTPTDGIAWSNTQTPALCRIEWTSHPRGLWLTNHFSETHCTSSSATSSIPRMFIEGSPSTVLHGQINSGPGPGGSDAAVDLDGNGSADVTFYRGILSNGYDAEEFIDVHADRPALILRPYTNGQLIAQTPTSSDAWTVYRWPMWLASRDFNDQPPEFTRGPWGGVTNAFLSVRMALQGGYHFGWIQLAFKLALIEGSTNMYWMRFQIPDCGLNAVPGEPIKAGQR